MDKAGLDVLPLLRRESQTVGPPLQRVTQQTLLGVIWATTALSFCFVVFRVYIRIKSFRKLFADDFLVVAAWLMLLTYAIVWQIKSDVLYWQYGVVAGTIPPSMAFLEAFGAFMPHIITWNILFYCCLWSIKFSFLLFFRRLGTDLVAPKYWWIVTVLTACGVIACIGDIDYGCTLKDIMYIMSECPKPDHVRFENRTFYANTVADLVTDALVMSIPISLVWNVQMPRRKKVLLLGLFSVTLFIMATAIARVSLIIKNGNQLQNASIDWLYLWSSVEMAMAIICACLASFRQLYTSVKKPKKLPLHNNDKPTPTMGGSEPTKGRSFLPSNFLSISPFSSATWTSSRAREQQSMALNSYHSASENWQGNSRTRAAEGGGTWRQRWSNLFRLSTSQPLDHNNNDNFPGSQTCIASTSPGHESELAAVHVKTSYDVTTIPTATSSVTGSSDYGRDRAGSYGARTKELNNERGFV